MRAPLQHLPSLARDADSRQAYRRIIPSSRTLPSLGAQGRHLPGRGHERRRPPRQACAPSVRPSLTPHRPTPLRRLRSAPVHARAAARAAERGSSTRTRPSVSRSIEQRAHTLPPLLPDHRTPPAPRGNPHRSRRANHPPSLGPPPQVLRVEAGAAGRRGVGARVRVRAAAPRRRGGLAPRRRRAHGGGARRLPRRRRLPRARRRRAGALPRPGADGGRGAADPPPGIRSASGRVGLLLGAQTDDDPVLSAQSAKAWAWLYDSGEWPRLPRVESRRALHDEVLAGLRVERQSVPPPTGWRQRLLGLLARFLLADGPGRLVLSLVARRMRAATLAGPERYYLPDDPDDCGLDPSSRRRRRCPRREALVTVAFS